MRAHSERAPPAGRGRPVDGTTGLALTKKKMQTTAGPLFHSGDDVNRAVVAPTAVGISLAGQAHDTEASFGWKPRRYLLLFEVDRSELLKS
jgi:hypothetical protein